MDLQLLSRTQAAAKGGAHIIAALAERLRGHQPDFVVDSPDGPNGRIAVLQALGVADSRALESRLHRVDAKEGCLVGEQVKRFPVSLRQRTGHIVKHAGSDQDQDQAKPTVFRWQAIAQRG